MERCCNRPIMWNWGLRVDHDFWRKLKERSETDMPKPSYYRVIDGGSYSKRWKHVYWAVTTMNFDGEHYYKIRWSGDKSKCWVCNCNSHETDKCLFYHYVQNCGHLISNKQPKH